MRMRERVHVRVRKRERACACVCLSFFTQGHAHAEEFLVVFRYSENCQSAFFSFAAAPCPVPSWGPESRDSWDSNLAGSLYQLDKWGAHRESVSKVVADISNAEIRFSSHLPLR